MAFRKQEGVRKEFEKIRKKYPDKEKTIEKILQDIDAENELKSEEISHQFYVKKAIYDREGAKYTVDLDDVHEGYNTIEAYFDNTPLVLKFNSDRWPHIQTGAVIKGYFTRYNLMNGNYILERVQELRPESKEVKSDYLAN